jgi:hypothetical protein
LHSTNWSDEEKKKGRTLQSSKNKNLIDFLRNEENGYLVPKANKTMKNITNEPNEAYKNIPQRRNHGRDR